MGLYKTTQENRPRDAPLETSEGVGVYEITLATGTQKDSGTDNTVSISIVGKDDRTSYRVLDNPFKNDFEKGAVETFKVKDRLVGDLLCVKVHKTSGGIAGDWYLRYINMVMPDGTKHRLPCYRWFTKKVPSITLVAGRASLACQESHAYLALLRRLEVEERRALYPWADKAEHPALKLYPGFHAAAADSEALPRDAQFDDEVQKDFLYTTLKSVFSTITGRIKRVFTAEKDIWEEYEKNIGSALEISETMRHIITHWQEDAEFGRQVRNGQNPMKVTRCEKIPEQFPVTQELIQDQLEEGQTLEGELQAGRMYTLSYPELEEFLHYEGQSRYMCAPWVLLHVRADRRLYPIAIQLYQTGGEHVPIYTPADTGSEHGPYSDWLIAKMWARVADVNFHQMYVHLMGTHLIMEPCAMTVMRNLPNPHPIYKLLIPHLRYVMAINTLGREALVPPGTAISKILCLGENTRHIPFMEKAYLATTYQKMQLPLELKSRGVDDAELLPDFAYRDDGLVLWAAIKDFTTDIVECYYTDDKQIEGDTELQAMLTDVRTNGYYEGFGLPEVFDSKEELVTFLTTIIFRCSCQHAAVNFGQMDSYGFTPNGPSCFMVPSPTEKHTGGWTEDEVRKVMPSHDISTRYIIVAKLLSSFSEEEIFLGHYPDEHFVDDGAKLAIEKFQFRLKEISEEIMERNKHRDCPFIYLLPERIPNSIAI